MKNDVIKLGVSVDKEGNYPFEIYRVHEGEEIKSYLEKIAWSKTEKGLETAIISTFSDGRQSRNEYFEAKRIEVIPLKGKGKRHAYVAELGGFVSSLAGQLRKDVLLHAKSKTIEQINSDEGGLK